MILLDVKTRAEGILSPLQSLDTVPQYFGPCQLECSALMLNFVYCNHTTQKQKHQFFLLLNAIIF